ncbi:MAG: hypothetical protein A7316_05240 [Candidatus Altiarchaeales archaeon WOR_SM1_86-2]|nr:MAG: hypothetical protein A7316_05240 [Candidatus Altiarchaeales archaeon WOR_SM1_86-2]
MINKKSKMQKQIYKELGGITKVVVFGINHRPGHNPLEDMMGIIKIDKEIDIEELIHQKGFENAGKHLGF